MTPINRPREIRDLASTCPPAWPRSTQPLPRQPAQHVGMLKKRVPEKHVVSNKSAHLWGRLENTQGLLRSYAAELFRRASPKLDPQVFILGILKEKEGDLPLIRVQPEDCGMDVELFKGASVLAKSIMEGDPGYKLTDDERYSYYGYHRDIERDSVSRAVKQLVDKNFQNKKVISFVSAPVGLGNYEILAVLQFNKLDYESFDGVYRNADTRVSFLDSLTETFFNEILAQLHGIRTPMNSALIGSGMNEVMRIAAATFVGRAIQAACYPVPDTPDYYANPFDLFNTCNYISSLNYEGNASAGEIIVGDRDNPDFDMCLELATPIGLCEYRKVRKLLEATSHDLALYADGHKILGLGRLRENRRGEDQRPLSINFGGLHKWELLHGTKKLLVVEHGIPGPPKSKINRETFDDLLQRTFGSAAPGILDNMWKIVDAATRQKHGALLIISSDAKGEAERLNNQSTRIRATKLDESLVGNITSIDGATLLDIDGTCYAIGVILDGEAVFDETSERGARYNSAVRYVKRSKGKCVAVIISEDGMVDLYPNGAQG